jgi:hypothetical protein
MPEGQRSAGLRLVVRLDQETLMPKTDSQPQTFVEMVLVLLEDRFPWLGTDRDASGPDTVDQLNDLHRTLLTAKRATGRRNRHKR